jgi:hypothetical protein
MDHNKDASAVSDRQGVKSGHEGEGFLVIIRGRDEVGDAVQDHEEDSPVLLLRALQFRLDARAPFIGRKVCQTVGFQPGGLFRLLRPVERPLHNPEMILRLCSVSK